MTIVEIVFPIVVICFIAFALYAKKKADCEEASNNEDLSNNS